MGILLSYMVQVKYGRGERNPETSDLGRLSQKTPAA